MWDVTLALAVILLACCALHGWGRLISGRGSWSLTMALGLALVIALGGVLNLARLAGKWPLTLLAAAGLVLFLAPFTRQNALAAAWNSVTAEPREVSGRLALIVLALAALVFTIATQVPPAVYNFHDDFQKYFAHPVRMLETGTLLSSPLSALGSETLGGMAFLLGFVTAYFPIQYVNGVDGAFSLFLCLLLVAGFAWQRPALTPTAGFAMVALFAINPQYVNVSALYTGSALMLAAIFLTADPAEHGSGPSLAVGLIHGALIALKPTFLLFTVLHLAFTALVRVKEGGFKWGGQVAGWTSLFLGPWIVLHGSHYLAAFGDPVPGALGVAGAVEFPLVDLFSTKPLFYGASLAHYSGLIAAVLLGAMAAFNHLGKKATDDALRRSASATLAAAGAGLAGYLLILHLGGPLLTGHGNAMRLFIPTIIALVPAAICLAALHLRHGENAYPALARCVPIVVAALIVAALVPDLRLRLTRVVEQGTQFAVTKLAASERYRDYNRLKLHPGAGKRIRAIQQRIPEGEPIIAWINAPFLLDYRRNPIIDVDNAGLNTPWARSPGVAHYVLWEYRGYGVRSPRAYAHQARRPGRQMRALARRGAAFMAFLRDQARRGKFLFNDGAMVVFRLPAPLRWP